jgi:hypothetical protein
MGQIPQYQTQEEARPLPTPYDQTHVTPDATGAVGGEVLQQAGAAVAQIARSAKAEADATAVIGAIGMAKGVVNSTILDPETGYVATRGADAVAKRDEYLKKFDQGLDKAAGTLQEGDQQRAFAQHLVNIREEGLRHLYTHEVAQQEDVAKAAFAGTSDETIKTMQASISNPAELNKQLGDLRSLATAEGIRRYGNNPAAIQAIVSQEMGRAAIQTMEAAVATQDPQIAASAFTSVQPFFLSNHEHVYGNQVRALIQRAQVAGGAQLVLKDGLDPVLLPGGATAMRPDSAKIDAGVAKLPDGPLRDQTAEEVQKRHNAYEKAWSQTVGQVFLDAEKSGTDPATGEFSMSRVPISLRTWLHDNANDRLIALRKEDAKSQRTASGTQRDASAEYLSALSADLHDPVKWADSYSRMTPGQFLGMLSDDKQFPGGFTRGDRKAAQKLFDTLQASATKLEEPIGRTVKATIAEAYQDDPEARKRFEAAHFEDLRAAAQRFLDTEKAAGRKVDTEAVSKFLAGKMNYVDSGSIFKADRRQIEIDAASAVSAPPAAKSVTSYRFNKARTQRIPVYSDGTQGTAEPNQ